MSTTLRTLRARLEADDQATPGLNKFGGTLDRLDDRAISLAKSFGAMIAGGALAKWLKDGVVAAAQAELEMRKFSSAVASAGLNVKETTDRASEFATALSRVTLFEDDAILSAQRMLIAIGGLSGEGLERATKASVDLATGLGIDLPSAANMLAKAATGSMAALSRYGLAAEDFEGVLTKVETKFNDVAKAASQTLAGSMEQATKSIGEFQESIGAILADMIGLETHFTQFTNGLNNITDALGSASDEGLTFRDVLRELLTWSVRLPWAQSLTAPFALPAMPTLPGAQQTPWDQFGPPAELANAPQNIRAITAAVEELAEALPPEGFTFTPRGLGNADGIFGTTLIDNTAREGQELAALAASIEAEITRISARATAERIALAEQERQQKMAAAGALLQASGAFVRAAFGQSKAAAIASALIDVASAVVNVWAHWAWNPPVAGALTALAVGTGLAQIANIRAAQIGGYAQGGIIPGIDHGRDSVPIMARPGEAVLPKELTDLLLSSGGGVEIHLHGDLAALVTEINRQTKRGNVRLVASEVRTSGLTR